MSFAPAPLTGRELAAIAGGAIAATLFAAVALAPLGPLAHPLVPILGLAAPALLVAHHRGGVRTVLGLTRPSGRALVGAVLVGASLWLVVVVALGPLLALLPDRARTEEVLAPLADPTTPLALRLAAYALLPALTEELLCRG